MKRPLSTHTIQNLAVIIAFAVAFLAVGFGTTYVYLRTHDPFLAGTNDDNTASGVAVTEAAVEVDKPQTVPVLCYHFFRDKGGPLYVFKAFGSVFLNLPLLNDTNVWTQNIVSFEHQMRYLRDQGYKTIDLDELVEWRLGHRELPDKSVIITFDDGDRSVLDLAYPILAKYGLKATLFVVTGSVGKKWQGVDAMTWDELHRLQDSGVFKIASHSHDLHYKVPVDDDMLPVLLASSQQRYTFPHNDNWRDHVYVDLLRSRWEILRHLGTETEFLAWPYGTGNAEIDSLAALAGFRGVCLLREAPNERFEFVNVGDTSKWEELEIKRYTITSRTSLKSFKELLGR